MDFFIFIAQNIFLHLVKKSFKLIGAFIKGK